MTNGVLIGDGRSIDFAKGSDTLQKYDESIKGYGSRARKNLDKYSLARDGTILGSNSFMNAQLGWIVPIATPAEVEKAVRANPDFFRGTYQDVGLVLRSNGDEYRPNDFVARNLAEQAKKRTGKMPTPKTPFRISLKGTSLKEDNSSDYGWVFVLGDETEVIEVPEFNPQNNGERFSKTDERGVPIFDNKGNRTFYAKSQGLSRLCLDWYLGLVSDGGSLAYSDVIGRVSIVEPRSGETAPRNFRYDQDLIHKALEDLKFAGIESQLIAKLESLREKQ